MRIFNSNLLFTVLLLFSAVVIGLGGVYAQWDEQPNADYFPRKMGNTWNYLGVDKDGKEHTYTAKIIDTERISGEEYFIVENKIDGELHSRYWFNSSASSIRVCRREQIEDAEKGIIEQANFYPAILAFVTLPSALGSTQITESTVEVFTIENEQVTDKEFGELTALSTAFGLETVDLPSGTFYNCIKYKREIQVGDMVTTVQYLWLAPEVGQVKFTLSDIEFNLQSCDLYK